MGKTTLADAVFSLQDRGCQYSHVRLFNDIDSHPDIVKLQILILKDLMGPEATIPDIRTDENGWRELEGVLRKVDAFIYIDNVLNSTDLKRLLPENMDQAKKVRILLTAHDVEDLPYACPTRPKIYRMKGIETRHAVSMLMKHIKKEEITENQFKDIVEICGGSPLMLTLVVPFFHYADVKQGAYDTLMQDKGKWENRCFDQMRCLFAYDAIPYKCKDPFMDICSFFIGWDWDTVKGIVGDEALASLESRALVTKDAKGLASVHDVIITLAHQKSKDESKGVEVRRTFTSVSELHKFIKEEKDKEGIKGIWFSGDTNVPFHISASTIDSMSKSLRVVHLGNLTTVEDNCSQIFEELLYFKAKITQLPFDVSKSKKLRYLTYKPNDLKLCEMPSSLRHVEFDGYSHSPTFQICDLQKLPNL